MPASLSATSTHGASTVRTERLVAVLAVSALLLLGATSAAAAHSRLFVLLFVAPVVEEAVFRAGLQEYLLRRFEHRWLSIGATAIVVAVAHAGVRGSVAALLVFIPAVVLGSVYQRTRQVRVCSALHAAMNAVWLVWMQ